MRSVAAASGPPPLFTDRGYAPVVVEGRGMGRSTGGQVMFFNEGRIAQLGVDLDQPVKFCDPVMALRLEAHGFLLRCPGSLFCWRS